MLIADGESSELWLFASADGGHLGTTARRGPGRREIDDLWRVWETPSGFVAEDATGKASPFISDGRFVRVRPRDVGDGARRVERPCMFDDTIAFGRALEDALVLAAAVLAMSSSRFSTVTRAAARSTVHRAASARQAVRQVAAALRRVRGGGERRPVSGPVRRPKADSAEAGIPGRTHDLVDVRSR
jgi:hypothetical protein